MEPAATHHARPYGFLGLALSTFAILAGSLILCLLAAALAAAVAAAVLGWQPMLDRLTALRAAADADAAVLPRVGVVVSLVSYAAISASVLLAARFRGGAGWRDLVGWHAWHPFRSTWLFWLIAAGTIAYSLAADALITHFYPPSKDWITLPKGPVWLGLFVVLAVVMAPLTEELMFRGWLYTSIRDKLVPQAASSDVVASVFDDRPIESPQTLDRSAVTPWLAGVWVSIFVTAALFALAHWEKSHLYALAVFPVGLVLGFCRQHAESLMASMTFHALYNGAALATIALGW